MNDYTEKLANEEYLLAAKWRISVDDQIGGWCIVPAVDRRTPAEGAIPVAEFVTQGVAEHIVELHNSTIGEV